MTSQRWLRNKLLLLPLLVPMLGCWRGSASTLPKVITVVVSVPCFTNLSPDSKALTTCLLQEIEAPLDCQAKRIEELEAYIAGQQLKCGKRPVASVTPEAKP